ncbi:MAG TPA: thiamine pyrophosphate-dependent dehydrogenase E1 component subunit alpha [Candidatus Polarisedimenticolia bacterium]|nr:thiamine pyrophosphate-dependent dehydrogenase E1 component subunit alpha [Candidatus Polarisedimenticolia bacterium]
MRRYPAFDPPEYASWAPDAEAMAEFGARVPADLPDEPVLLRLYEGMLRTRLHDIALKRWVRQGVISKAWLGTGEEAVTVGNVHALEPSDVVGPMIRNAGACHEMGMPVADMLKAYLGAHDTITQGRDLHTGDPERGIIPPTSFVASLVPVFAGIAISFKLKGQSRVAMTWVGDGARWTAEFHEGLSLAAVQRAPLLLVLQDNQVALGTRREAHSKAGCHEMAAAYGVEGITCDGNNVLDVHAATRRALKLCRQGRGPVLLTAATFRMGGHATHDEAEGRALFSAETFARWGRRDPIGTYETWLTATRGVPAATLAAIEERVTREIDEAAETALAGRRPKSATEADVLRGLYSAEGAHEPAPAVIEVR